MLDDLRAALRERYPVRSYALFYEVPNATGTLATRRADALVVGLWPSRGLEVEGFEFKASRNDWLTELKKPEKAEAVAKFCDRWWIATTKPGIVKKGELPKTWGLYELHGEKLKRKKAAPPLTAQPMDRKFLASLCREVQRQIGREEEFQKKVDEAARMKFVAWTKKQRAQKDESLLAEEYRLLKNAVDEFEKASGVTIGRLWESGKIGAAVQAVLAAKSAGPHALQQLESSARAMEGTAVRLRRNHERLTKLLKDDEAG